MWKITFIVCLAFVYGTAEVQEIQACKVCNLLVGEIQEFVSRGSTQELIMDYIRGICSALPSEQKDVCGMFIGDNSLNLFNKVLTDLTPHQFCDSAPHICPPHYGEDRSEIIAPDVHIEEQSVHGVSECEVCQFLVKSVNDLVSGERAYSVVDETVETICSQLPGNLQPFCHVKGDALVQHVVKHGYDALDACTKIDACAAHEKDISHAVDEPIPKEPVEVVKGITSNNLSEDDKKHQKKKMPVETIPTSDLKCELCEGVLELLEKRIQRTANEDMIKETLYELCNDLQTDLKNLCLQEAPQIIKALEEELNPFETCQKVMLCDATLIHGIKKTDILASLVKRMTPAPKQIPPVKKTDEVKDVKCELCTGVIEELDSLLQQNATITKITAALHDICSQMDRDLVDLCFLIAPDIVKAIMTGEDSQKACEAIKLCQTEEDVGLGDLKCDLCEFIIKEVDQLVGKNASIDKVNATVYKLCNDLSGTIKAFCLLIAPTIVKEIVSGADPQKACTTMKLCVAEADTSIVLTANEKQLECGLCMMSLNPIIADIAGNYAKVQWQLLKLCSNLPVVYRTTCFNMLQNDNGRIFKQFLENYSPTLLCEMLACYEDHDHAVKNRS